MVGGNRNPLDVMLSYSCVEPGTIYQVVFNLSYRFVLIQGLFVLDSNIRKRRVYVGTGLETLWTGGSIDPSFSSFRLVVILTDRSPPPLICSPVLVLHHSLGKTQDSDQNQVWYRSRLFLLLGDI